MRIFKLAIAGVLVATAAMPTVAIAQRGGGYQRAIQQVERECARHLRRADNRRERMQAQRECRRDRARVEREYRGRGRDRGNWRN